MATFCLGDCAAKMKKMADSFLTITGLLTGFFELDLPWRKPRHYEKANHRQGLTKVFLAL